jgi:hypothetical protein
MVLENCLKTIGEMERIANVQEIAVARQLGEARGKARPPKKMRTSNIQHRTPNVEDENRLKPELQTQRRQRGIVDAKKLVCSGVFGKNEKYVYKITFSEALAPQ